MNRPGSQGDEAAAITDNTKQEEQQLFKAFWIGH